MERLIPQMVGQPASPPPPGIAPLSSPEPRLPAPEQYEGDPESCRSFLSTCLLVFELQHSSFPTERSRVAYVITLLSVSSMKRFTDRHRRPPPQFKVGQKVWLSARDIPLRTTSPKLASRFIGPFPITRVITPTANRLNLPPPLRGIHPVFHIFPPEASRHLEPPSSHQEPLRLPVSWMAVWPTWYADYSRCEEGVTSSWFSGRDNRPEEKRKETSWTPRS